MKWNVFRCNANKNNIEVFNIFDHYYFNNEVSELLKNKELNKEEFEEKLKINAMYYFWSKYEHEIVITSSPPYIQLDEIKRIKDSDKCIQHVTPETYLKIDIYQQIQLNWDKFIEYVWSFREEK